LATSETIYRRAALERLSSPEQLDHLVGLTSPLQWLSALALAGLIALAGAWSLFGSLAVTVEGEGILVTRGGQVFDAMAPESGALASIAEIGRVVHKGEVVATLDDSAWRADLDHARAALAEREADQDALKRALQSESDARGKNRDARRANLNDIIAAAQQRADFYRDLVGREAAAVANGVVTARTREDNRREMTQAQQEVGQARGDLLKLDGEDIDFAIRRDHELAEAQEKINEARRHVEEMSLKLVRGARIVAAQDGVVTETKASPGAVVAQSKPILSIATAGQGLELLLYIPPQVGKSVRPGMDARIALAAFKREEFGALEGRIASVSDYPVTREGMVSQMQNEQLAQSFSRLGAPYSARVDLRVAPDTPSGYRWTGGAGPAAAITSGATATADIVVGRHPPIYFVLPLLERWFGHGG
jgi:HlyD family secretion protein